MTSVSTLSIAPITILIRSLSVSLPSSYLSRFLLVSPPFLTAKLLWRIAVWWIASWTWRGMIPPFTTSFVIFCTTPSTTAAFAFATDAQSPLKTMLDTREVHWIFVYCNLFFAVDGLGFICDVRWGVCRWEWIEGLYPCRRRRFRSGPRCRFLTHYLTSRREWCRSDVDVIECLSVEEHSRMVPGQRREENWTLVGNNDFRNNCLWMPPLERVELDCDVMTKRSQWPFAASVGRANGYEHEGDDVEVMTSGWAANATDWFAGEGAIMACGVGGGNGAVMELKWAMNVENSVRWDFGGKRIQ